MKVRQREAVVLAALCSAVALLLAVASAASGIVHVTNVNLSSTTISSLSVVSTGDAGQANNMVPGTSLATTAVVRWYNQPAAFMNPVLVDADADADMVTSAAWWRLSTDAGATWSAATTFAPSGTSVMASTQGIYSVVATGFDADDPAAAATGTVNFGLDMTGPTSHTDLPPGPANDPDGIVTFDTPALVTITATDTLSGVERVQYDLDGSPTDFTHDAVAGSPFTVPVTVSTSGFHVLSWKVWDNAGNVSRAGAVFIVRPIGFKPNVSLGVGQSGSRGRIVRFSGDIDPMATDQTVVVTVKRKVGTNFTPFATYTATLAKFTDDYNIKRTINRAGTFRATTTVAGGKSKTRTFTTH